MRLFFGFIASIACKGSRFDLCFFYAGLHVQCVILVLPRISLFFSVKLHCGGGEYVVKGSGFSCTFLFCGKMVSNIIHGFLQVMIWSWPHGLLSCLVCIPCNTLCSMGRFFACSVTPAQGSWCWGCPSVVLQWAELPWLGSFGEGAEKRVCGNLCENS